MGRRTGRRDVQRKRKLRRRWDGRCLQAALFVRSAVNEIFARHGDDLCRVVGSDKSHVDIQVDTACLRAKLIAAALTHPHARIRRWVGETLYQEFQEDYVFEARRYTLGMAGDELLPNAFPGEIG